MPIDPHRFPAPETPRVEVRRRTARPASVAEPIAARRSGSTAAPVARPNDRAKSNDRASTFEPPTILPIVFPQAKVAPPRPAAVEAATVEETATELSRQADVAVPSPAPIDPRATLLGPSEMAPPEVPTLRYDAAELAPMLEEMAVRKVLLEQTLVRMRQALDEEQDEIAREAEAIAATAPAAAKAAAAKAPAERSPRKASGLGAFFWIGSALGAGLVGWGLFWIVQGALIQPSLLQTGGLLAIFGAVACASNVLLHLDAIFPRGATTAEG